MPTEVQSVSPKGKGFRMDLRCDSYDGTQFIIEVQKYYQADFYRRCVAYSSSVYWSKGRIGMPYADFMPVYLIAFLSDSATTNHGFHRPEFNDRIIYHYRMQEKTSGEVPYDTINVIFAELEKFRKAGSECKTEIEKWLFVLKNMSRLDDLPEDFRNEVFIKLFRAVNVNLFSDMDRREYISRWFAENDEKEILRSAKNEGFEEGMEKGREEGIGIGLQKGREEGMIETAKKMLKDGLDIQMVCRYTGLTAEVVGAL